MLVISFVLFKSREIDNTDREEERLLSIGSVSKCKWPWNLVEVQSYNARDSTDSLPRGRIIIMSIIIKFIYARSLFSKSEKSGFPWTLQATPAFISD